MEYNVEANKWYSPNEISDKGLLFGKSKRYIFEVINNGKLKATNTSDTPKPHWKIYGQDLINFIKQVENDNENI